MAEWDAVHTVSDYYDGSSRGVADYLGEPHVYKCEWDEAADDWSGVFILSPINSEIFQLVQEDWRIWLRWKYACDNGQLGDDDQHPALAIDRNRHEELQVRLALALRVDAAQAIRATPNFRGSLKPLVLEVRWSRV